MLVQMSARSIPSIERHVRRVIKLRAIRAAIFDAKLFPDPAWNILLYLYRAELAQHRVPAVRCCAAAEVPQTTALRLIGNLCAKGLLVRSPDPLDRRRMFIRLSPEASERMTQFFDEYDRLAA